MGLPWAASIYQVALSILGWHIFEICFAQHGHLGGHRVDSAQLGSCSVGWKAQAKGTIEDNRGQDRLLAIHAIHLRSNQDVMIQLFNLL